MTAADVLSRALSSRGTASSETGVFVRMNGRFAVVNIGTSTVTVPCLGFTPPVPGMPVKVEWVNGSPLVTGPVRPLNPVGRVTAAGTPRATVLVDGVSYLIPVMASYTPVVNDEVVINWNLPNGMVMGKVAAVDAPEPPGENGGAEKPFTVVVRAAGSGRYEGSSRWGNSDPWASLNNVGIWVYGNRVKDAVGSGTVSAVEIYLPMVQQIGGATIGVHPHPWLPPGAPTITTRTNLPIGRRAGWQRLPASFGPYLAAGGRGIGVADGGYNIWRGVASDGLSGALRISGTR